ncbi:unnamed protein product [Cylindrotheca closterium]|uniref:Uncharacterized protein n=1 Tax=Cylindrotheca closterium TaxID=2856 RepID=A0AAD2CFM8_9STRA|nr:unnamed protein product [Cylindrotheca closterium]
MCVTIIQKETDLSTAEYLGHNEGAHWVGDKNDIKGNTGPDKFFCGGPTVNFNGIDIPPLVVHSSSGGITPEILTLVEDRLDELNVFPRGNGKPDPVILVDAHGSRLSAKFLNYVFNKAHRWIVLFGLPNGTGFWQVGDSNAQNGNMKAHLVKAKREVLQMRMAKGQRAAISRKDVVPLVTSGWDKSFGHIENNKRACAKTQSRMPCAPRDPPDEG